MAANFLHGIETLDVTDGVRSVRVVKTAVIGLIGTAAIWQAASTENPADLIDTPRLCLNDTDDVKRFGAETTGYTIPTALDLIRDQGRGVPIVVNVFDPARHKVAVAVASFTFPTTGSSIGVITLPHRGARSLVVTNVDASVTYVSGVDYDHSPVAGTITRKTGGAIAAGATIKANYDRPAPELVTASDIIGAVDGPTGKRTGLKALLTCMSRFGFSPKLLISPGFAQLAGVATEMDSIADKLRAIAITPAPAGTSVEAALAGRGPLGTINFNTSSDRRVLLFGHLKRLNPVTSSEHLVDPSSVWAGMCAETDLAAGYWVSPSNREILGVTGTEFQITSGINDATSEANILNEAGICTWFNIFGSGLRAWGNRSAMWPSDSDPRNFIAIRRVFDVISESVEVSLLPFIDRPLTPAVVDHVLDTVNAFCRRLVSDGALIDGRYRFDPARNPTDQLMAGQLTLTADLTPPAPMERITIEQRYDATGLKAFYEKLSQAA